MPPPASFLLLARLQHRSSGDESSPRALSSLRTSSGKPHFHHLHMPQVKPSGSRNSTSARDSFASAADRQRQRGPTTMKLGVLGFQAVEMLHHQWHQFWYCGGRELTLEGNRNLRSEAGFTCHPLRQRPPTPSQHLHKLSTSCGAPQSIVTSFSTLLPPPR
jgi:hypothetical protein